MAAFWAVCLAATAVYLATAHLTISRGAVKVFRKNSPKVYPSHVLFYALLLAASFGVLYLHLSNQNPAHFSVRLDWKQALYFSVVTFATVGYGDIHPDSEAARWMCMSEIVLGLVMLVLAVNATMTVWLKNDKEEELTEEDVAYNKVVQKAKATFYEKSLAAVRPQYSGTHHQRTTVSKLLRAPARTIQTTALLPEQHMATLLNADGCFIGTHPMNRSMLLFRESQNDSNDVRPQRLHLAAV